MKIDIWSDVVCPFCFIGKRNLELALEQFPHADEVEVNWHSFELDPQAPAEIPGTLAEYIAKKYGTDLAQSIASQEQIAASAAAVGLNFNWEEAKPGNTFNAHRMIHFAKSKGIGDAAETAYFKAYFTDGLAVGTDAVVKQVALELGLPEDEVDDVLATDKFGAEVRLDEQMAAQLGISGVPFFLIENKWALNGAQPVEIMVGALNQIWDELHPAAQNPNLIHIDGADSAEACGPNGC